jgi:diguanylate cyclase (GGDEF)-like protein
MSVVGRGPDDRPRLALAIIHDVTREKRAETQLRESEDFLNLSLEIGGVGTYRRDYINRLIYCSPTTRTMNGLPPGDAPIPDSTWFATVLPEDAERLTREWAAGHARQAEIMSLEYRFMHPQTGIRHVETRSRVIYDSKGLPVGSRGVVIDVTDRRRVESRLAYMAQHDPLTELPNRTLFQMRLGEALERAGAGERSAIFCLDLDRFKEINDSLGHHVGDLLLKAVTRRLRASCRPSDTVARLGGDEFAIIQSPVLHRSDAAIFAERILQFLAQPYEIEGLSINVTASIGVAIAPDDGLEAHLLLRRADLALYAAKDGGGGYKTFAPEMGQRLQALRAFETRLSAALGDGALQTYYQPVIGIARQLLTGFEALLRWRDPERGIVPPDEFIPLAEANGQISQIGAFVLNRACAEAASWPERTKIAVNISATELARPDLADLAAAALAASGLEPHRLELEITERSILQTSDVTTDTLRRLKALGVKLSIDDFGTGFSSLSYLQDFRFDKVKIDRAFIARIEASERSRAIVRAIVNLCASLGIETTAEGVETAGQLAILRDMGCEEAQGFYFSPPRPADEIFDLVSRFRGPGDGT